jgi:PEP-CTERM motif
LTALGDFTGSPTKDLYTFVGCTSCNNSLGFTNLIAGITADTTLPSAPTAFDIYEAVVTVNFSGKDAINVIGSFAEGTYIAPVSGGGVDTSFTNAGLITGSAVINPVIGGTAPEPSTWAMMLAGFGLLGLAAYRRKRRESIGVA